MITLGQVGALMIKCQVRACNKIKDVIIYGAILTLLKNNMIRCIQKKFTKVLCIDVK